MIEGAVIFLVVVNAWLVLMATSMKTEINAMRPLVLTMADNQKALAELQDNQRQHVQKFMNLVLEGMEHMKRNAEPDTLEIK